MTFPFRSILSAADLPPVWLFLCAVLVWALARWAPLLDLSHPMLDWAGRVLIAAALVAMLWSAMWFNRLGTPIIPRRRPTALIAEGPYRLSRNPIYLADLALLIGWWLLHPAISGLVAPPLFWWIVTKRFIEPEEDMLRQVFGTEAEAYFARVRRWI